MDKPEPTLQQPVPQTTTTTTTANPTGNVTGGTNQQTAPVMPNPQTPAQPQLNQAGGIGNNPELQAV